MNRIECRFEDWDDTVLPRPVCHCMKREGVDCANGSYVKWCPDYEPKPQPDQSRRLLTEDEILKALMGLHDKGLLYCASVITGYQDIKTASIKDAEISQQYIKGVEDGARFSTKASDARIGALIDAYDAYVKVLGEEIKSMMGLAPTHGWHSTKTEIGKKCRATIKELKAIHRKANPTSEVEG